MRSIQLMSDNPLKLLTLREFGFSVWTQEAHAAGMPLQNGVCMRSKRERLGHLLGQHNDEAPSP